MHALAIAAQKGGVGKTTSAVNLAYYLARDHRVLLVDADSQGQAGAALGLSPEARHFPDLLAYHHPRLYGRRYVPARETVCREVRPGLDVIGCDVRLKEAEGMVARDDNRALILRRRLGELATDYDLCILDMGPGIADTSEYALMAADYVLVPAAPGPAPREGVEEVVRRLEDLREAYAGVTTTPDLLGVFPTMLDSRENVSRDLAAWVTGRFGDAGAPAIRKSAKLAESYGKGTIWEYAPTSSGAEDYAALAAWIAARAP